MISAIVLTKNEEIHIARCLNNLKKINAKVKIIDSGSTDDTLKIALAYDNVEIYHNKWINYANQFNWAILNSNVKTEWVLRIDADEYLEPDLIAYINNDLYSIPEVVTGIFVKRALIFLDKKIEHGSGDVYHLKIWRNGFAFCENKWMDEHMQLTSGNTTTTKACLIDHNLKSISNFISKHNDYATREAMDYFAKYINKTDLVKSSAPTHEKKTFYYKSPIFLRCLAFYLYAMIFKFGIFDGARGFIYHTLQKLIYRLIVDFKIYEAKYLSKKFNINELEVIMKNANK